MDLSTDSPLICAAPFTAYVAIELGVLAGDGILDSRALDAMAHPDPFATRAEAWAHAWSCVRRRFEAQGQSIQGLRPSYFFKVVPRVFESTAEGARSIASPDVSIARLAAPHPAKHTTESGGRVAESIREGIERGLSVRRLLARVESEIDSRALEAQTTYAYTRPYGGAPTAHYSHRAFALIDWLRELADPWERDGGDRILRFDDDSQSLGIASGVSLSMVEQGGVLHFRFGAEDAPLEGSVNDLLSDEWRLAPDLIRDLDEEEAMEDAEADCGA